ncbi:MAG: SAM-dependent chlorinase/fluorinase [Deltaproteobacteria bacterium]|jgi:S-adenosylmethionine hydrolase
MPVISILSDFGTDDEYVGVMKGVILSICPSVTIVDITHRIDPQDIHQAAYLLPSYYRFFPEGTVHIVVIDPEVGSRRGILAVKHREHFFIAPDNGVLSLLLNAEKSDTIIRVDNSAYFLKPLSSTFHGRDIFAALGAHLSCGTKLDVLGSNMDVNDTVHLKDLRCRISQAGELIGKIVSIDRFGNLITNIDSISLAAFCETDDLRRPQIHIGSFVISELSGTYSDAAPAAPLALIGSRNYLEIAVNGGNAKKKLQVKKGDPVRLTLL